MPKHKWQFSYSSFLYVVPYLYTVQFTVMKIQIFILACLVTATHALAQSPAPQMYWQQYVIERGDTLEGISQNIQNQTLQNMTIEEIVRLLLQYNHNVSHKDRIYPNQIILIPTQYEPYREPVEEPADTFLPVAEPQEKIIEREVIIQESKPTQQRWVLDARGSLGYRKIKSEDAASGGEGTFLSKINPGFHLRLQNQTLEQFTWGVGFGQTFYRFETSGSTSLENQTEIFHHLYFQLIWTVSKKTHIRMEMGLEENAFISALAVDTFSLDAIWQPYLSLGIAHNIHLFSKWTLTPILDVAYQMSNFSDRYKIDPAFAVKPEVLVSYKTGFGSILASVWYEYQAQEAEISSQRQQDLTISAGVSFDL